MRVWAPHARRVDLVVFAGGTGEERHPMVTSPDGWWRAEADLLPGTDYAYSLDGGPPRPDPRSCWQPAGVHGPSRTFDATAHTWTDQDWPGVDARGAVTYELHVGTFSPTGTLDAAADRLEHLARLGVDLVELMPVAAFNGRHGWGYDGVDLFAVHEPYGGPAALQRFVDRAHAQGLGVCLDVVYNHFGPSGNYLPEFGPYLSGGHDTPWGDAVNLDGPGSAHVRRFICDNALRWFADFHVDALRLDAVHALVDTSPRHLLAQLSDEVGELSSRLGRPLSLVAECDLNDPVTVRSTEAGGWGLTGQWADDVHHAVHALLTGERQGYYVDFGPPPVLRTALREVFVHQGGYSTFRGRTWGQPVPADVDGHRFVVAASNHDQVGNRALGDRPSARLDPGGLAAAAALVLLSPYSPLIFMGEEWGADTPFQYFSDHPEPELAAAVSAGRAAEFADFGTRELYGADITVPDPQDPTTFARSHLDWTQPATGEHGRLLEWYRTLLGLRAAVADLRSGDRSATDLVADPLAPRTGPYAGWLLVRRGTTYVAVNRREAATTVPLPPTAVAREVLAGWGECAWVEGGIRLSAGGVVVVA